MVNLASKQTFKVVEYVLEKKEFTQYSAKKGLKLAMGTVNNCFSFLLEKGFIQKKEKKYVLVDAVGLIEAVSFFRSMKDSLLFEYSSSYDKTELSKLIPESAVFCLESALQQYSNYYTTNIVSVYLSKKDAILLKKKLGIGFGSKTVLKVFEAKPLISKTIEKNGKFYTTLVRTVIDLACDKKGAMADSLIGQFWGKK